METKRNSQLLVPLILLSVLFSQTWALTALEEEALRNVRHADGVSSSEISSLLDDHSPKDYLEFLIKKRASDDISEDLGPSKRDEESECSACLAAIDKFLKENLDSNHPAISVGTEMETKRNSQLLVPLILLSVLFSQTWALTALEEEALSDDISEDLGPSKRDEESECSACLAAIDKFLKENLDRNVRHADGVSTSDISSLLDDYPPKDYTESLMEKRLSDDISEDLGPSKRSEEESACSSCLAAIEKFLKEHPERLELVEQREDSQAP
ncbi:hypothetical protein QTO34_001027, partial [Cnephaeus nilssonii]